MSISRQTLDQYLYEFDQAYRVTYVNYSRANELTDAQLILTLERGCERKTFAFSQPHFNDVDKNLIACHGLYIAAIKSSPLAPNRVEVGDIEGGFSYFTAKNVKNITPTA
ncbi:MULTISPECIES: hypothetical protein [Oceanospirillaceae]|jgi:hypothetical protein|uniref:hypothetical protein n=1 Tax=Oceanospirillaceae TaxID=135620 RepID=UPI000C43CF7D|nr:MULTISPECIES: hypothetical protein [Thalassolituus]MAY15058.1 hypothetical protein [Oceanospirillaceae bacterium]MBU2038537.1 hypothetical protein [Gammaproteobacteria bacterium]MCA6061613.1 hypothetical protein [Thalassolituus sp. ST750PaO-4]MCB2386415.1 hypothetical protein [Thalassolituus alkanivorans]MCB2422162.1 hypothetical protein [Thalassolituus alkanivorans]|tara:strand:- start:137 stop:466 length:330 start_codon:yes stop_codon:yes gene_type:complete